MKQLKLFSTVKELLEVLEQTQVPAGVQSDDWMTVSLFTMGSILDEDTVVLPPKVTFALSRLEDSS